jgi:hypothetical protein
MDSAASPQSVDPRRYFESVETGRDVPEHEPAPSKLLTDQQRLFTTRGHSAEALEGAAKPHAHPAVTTLMEAAAS